MEHEEIVSGVRSVLADRLALTEDSITIESSLIDDLGADSLDFLDLIFSLERKFNITLRDVELNSFLKADFNPETLTEEGYIKPENLGRLREFIPALQNAGEQIKPGRIFRLITVESMVLLVERRIN